MKQWHLDGHGTASFSLKICESFRTATYDLNITLKEKV